jgi:hypothetical protein
MQAALEDRAFRVPMRQAQQQTARKGMEYRHGKQHRGYELQIRRFHRDPSCAEADSGGVTTAAPPTCAMAQKTTAARTSRHA